ncbi:PREDICTED: 46 kDa FK506-binding nuclear [Prunus dulcis]|uniref:PREDICTED: 46 kDa FK506-binding nuclear n=1 Tax=Prunus dulcis TaxID=3755 RepID=A0A5E4EHD8_PRUDU|nr:PREDICTED: 46 kDa FK506-binding nuclear [Prunus dulcis]
MKRKTKKETERDEVEELLQAAQDDMLLKLSLNSHLSRGVSLDDADIGRRFEALKMKTVITGAAPGAGAEPAAAAASSFSVTTSPPDSPPSRLQFLCPPPMLPSGRRHHPTTRSTTTTTMKMKLKS